MDWLWFLTDYLSKVYHLLKCYSNKKRVTSPATLPCPIDRKLELPDKCVPKLELGNKKNDGEAGAWEQEEEPHLRVLCAVQHPTPP